MNENHADRRIRDRRALPSVSTLLEEVSTNGTGHAALVAAIRDALAEARDILARGGSVSREGLLESVSRQLAATTSRWPRRVINATGVVLHTNLGRAALSDDACAAMLEAASYSDLEMNLDSGARGRRDAEIERLLVELTGAEAATIVNNNASALVLALTALARGREVVVSRGQAVEIGGRFRIPDVLEQSGAVLREVGTTNRTYASDYHDACNERTALLLRVHASNFHMSGFVHEVGIRELALVGRERSVMVLDDLGSGCLVDTDEFGLRHEPTVGESVSAGADVCVFSGDKLLGGPQAGLIVGREEPVERLRRHPLMRALRCDKVTLAAMHATLLHYRNGEALEKVPTLRMLARTREELQREAERWLAALGLPGVEVRDSVSEVGGGSLPGVRLPSAALVIDNAPFGVSADELAARLRRADPPVIARVERARLWLDARTVGEAEVPSLLRSLREVLLA